MTSMPSQTMRAVVFDSTLRLVSDYPVPQPSPGWALVQVRTAGICQTDMEIMRGYMAFSGVLGHEFIGTVDQCDDGSWPGKRVAGEINAACGRCEWCRAGLGRHCPNRSVLGIQGLDGCMADYCVLPTTNLLELPTDIPDDRAVFLEPLSAACEILEQVPLSGGEHVVVVGDGRLGILCAWVISTLVEDVTLVGHHREKLDTARWRTIRTMLSAENVPPGADIVISATPCPQSQGVPPGTSATPGQQPPGHSGPPTPTSCRAG